MKWTDRHDDDVTFLVKQLINVLSEPVLASCPVAHDVQFFMAECPHISQLGKKPQKLKAGVASTD